jgi:Haem-NO-binding
MKGIVADALHQLVTTAFGPEAWTELLARSGMEPSRTFTHNEDLPFDTILAMFGAACDLGGMTFEQACDAYGAFWVGTYIPARYPGFYDGVSTAKAFLLKLDAIHAAMARRMPGATPPRHSYRWIDGDTLEMGYASSYEGLQTLFIGAVKGAAAHFGDTIAVERSGDQAVRIVFH